MDNVSQHLERLLHSADLIIGLIGLRILFYSSNICAKYPSTSYSQFILQAANPAVSVYTP